jgi:hypothetical protein
MATMDSKPGALISKPRPRPDVTSNALKIEIARDGDFIIQLTPEAKPALAEKPPNSAHTPQPPKRTRVVQFRVSRAVMQKHSIYFEQLFRARADLASTAFENRGIGFGYALEVWLRAVHTGAHKLPANLKATHTERAWVAIGVGEQFGTYPLHTMPTFSLYFSNTIYANRYLRHYSKLNVDYRSLLNLLLPLRYLFAYTFICEKLIILGFLSTSLNNFNAI